MRKKRSFLTAASLAGVFSVLGVGTAFAYLSDFTEPLWNPFTIALDSTTTVIEKYPIPEEDEPNTPVPGGPDGLTIDYEKAVQIGNTGYIDCYVRVRVDFSEDDIANKSSFSWDGTNWYSIKDYDDHLPEGWVKDGDYYYYTPILYADKWDDVKQNLIYDKNHGEHFYDLSTRELMIEVCLTTPLIRYVKTDFESPIDMRTYDIHVYDESVPSYFGNDYKQAWENYLYSMSDEGGGS